MTSRGSSEFVLRTETDTTPIRSIPAGVLSSDGSRVAYFAESAGAELHVFESGGSDRVVATFSDRRAGAIAWSADGTGLLVSLATPAADPRFLIPRVLTAVDIVSGASREVYIATGPSGASIFPLAWRREPEIFAAFETGPGGYSFGYTVIRPGMPPVRTDPDGQALGFAASADGTLIVGHWPQEGTLKVWPIDDFSKKVELRPVADEQFANPRWWPDRGEITFAVGRHRQGESGFRDVRIERWDPVSGARTVLKRLTDSAILGGYLIRADGSGIITQGPYPPGAWEVTDLRSGVSNAVPLLERESIVRGILIR